MSTKSNGSNGSDNEWGQVGSLLADEQKKQINKLYSDISSKNEFEVMFYNYNDTVMNYEKYRMTLAYMTQRSKAQKLSIKTYTVLDIIYAIDGGENSYRISIEDITLINKYMKMLHQKKNHVIFRVLASMLLDNNKDVTIMKKVKDRENVVDVDDFDLRVRKAEELSVGKKELEQLAALPETEREKITFRFKERVSLFIHDDDERFLRIDLTRTKTTKQINKTEYANARHELEIELGLKNDKVKPSSKFLTEMIQEINILLKILQQSNFIITRTKSNEVLNEYARILGVDLSKATALDERRAQSLEIQHVTEILPNKFAPTDKADGERYFLVILNGKVFLISHNLVPKDTGIVLSSKLNEFNDTVLDGEYIYIPAKKRYLFMVFDCLHHGSQDTRKIISLMERLQHADDIINSCFIFKEQHGLRLLDYTGNFEIKKIVEFHTNQLEHHLEQLNKDIEHETHLPLVRRKYFIQVYGGKDYEVFKYAELLWDTYMFSKKVKCPYHLDGLIFHPLMQEYITSVKESRYVEYKWKPPTTNSIDFYIQFERDDSGKILTVYDNSIDEFVKNKPYRICYLNVGQWSPNGEQPTLFQKDAGNFLAHLFLEDGEVRDVGGNILLDKTVVEMFYNNDPNTDSRFRWIAMRTRYDKTESVQRHKKGYGNYIDVANKVWRSITNPILIEDVRQLSNELTYYRHMDSLKKRIGHELIVSAAKENVYFQIRTNLAKPMRNFHNWIKSIFIYTHCHPVYQGNKNLSVLDLACGRGADLMKFYYSKVSLYVGVDIDYDALTSAVDGAVSRYSKFKKSYPNFPKMFFIQANVSVLLDKSEQEKAMINMHPDNKTLMEKFFSLDANKRTYFDRINCQFAIHYFFQNDETWSNFKENCNMYLKNSGYLLVTTVDARTVLKMLGTSDKYTVYYTNTKGEKKILFDIVKKFENDKIDLSKPIPPGYPIDLHNAWISLEGVYNTEYLVDHEFIKQDLLKSCGLELVDTDLFSNQFELQRNFFANIMQYEENPDTKKFFNSVKEYYNQSDEINKACYESTRTYRYYVFRKKDDFSKGNPKQSSVVTSIHTTIDKRRDQERPKYVPPQKRGKESKERKESMSPNDIKDKSYNAAPEYSVVGGSSEENYTESYTDSVSEVDSLDKNDEDEVYDINNLFDKKKFYIGEIKDADTSYYSSVFELLKNDEVVPNETSATELYKDLGIKLVPDDRLDRDDMYVLTKKLKIEHEVKKGSVLKKQMVLNGLNIFTVELDCNGHYDVNLVSKNDKLNLKDKSIILIQEGTHFRPVFKIDDNGNSFKGIYTYADEIIDSLIQVAA